MSWPTIATMVFALGCVYGGLVLTITLALKRRNPEEEE